MSKFIKLFKKDKDEFGYLTDEPFDIRKIIPVAALLAVVILLAGLIASFIVSDIIFRIRKRPRDRQMLKGAMQA